MASVTGRTADSIDALLDLMVVSVRIDTNGQLIWKNRKGEETNQGSIVSPKLAVEAAWPVGSIFISTSAANPNTLLGNVGTWVRFAKGRTLVSLDEAQTEFDAPEEVGGAKTVTLTANQSGMPYHSHAYSGSGSTGASGVSASVASDDATTNPVGGASLDRGAGGGDRSINGSSHAHSFSYSGTTAAAAANASEAHNNLPPYVVVYMWKRTA